MTATERRNFWIGLGVVLFLAAAAVVLASLAWRYAPQLAPQASSTSVTALVTFLGSVLTLGITKKWDRHREIQQEHRKQKTPLYEEFITFLFKLFMTAKAGSTPMTENEMMEVMVKFTRGLTVWGSNDVIRRYGEFRQMSAANPDAKTMACTIEDIMISIRADLGHPSGLRRGDLLRLFINDLHTIIPSAKP